MTKALDAYEARNLMYSGPPWEDCMEWLYAEIRRCAAQGGKELVFLIPPNYPTSMVENELRCKGFTVENEGSCASTIPGNAARITIKWGY